MAETFTRRYSDKTPTPPGYAVEYWECDEHYHWVTDDFGPSGDANVNHWACWRGAWAHYRAALSKASGPEKGGT